MKKIILPCLLCLAFGASAQWGEEAMSDKPEFKDRIFVGGGLGFTSNSYADFFSISPMVGYRFTNKLAGGMTFQYRFTKLKVYNPAIKTNDYGVAPFLRYNVFGPIFLHTEYEYLNYEFPTTITDSRRISFNSFLLGGGFFQPLGRNAGLFAMALYNFSYKAAANSFEPRAYDSPWVIRVGITAGF